MQTTTKTHQGGGFFALPMIIMLAIALPIAYVLGTSVFASSVQPHEGIVSATNSYICCFGNEHFVIQINGTIAVDCSFSLMAGNDISIVTHLNIGDKISMSGDCHNVKVLK